MNKLLIALMAVAASLNVPTALGPLLQFPVMFGLLCAAVYIIQPLWDDVVQWGIGQMIILGENYS